MIRSDILRSFLKMSLPILLAVGIIWWLYRDLALEDFMSSMEQIDYPIFALSLLYGLSANVLRGLRWHLLTTPIARDAGVSTRASNAIATVLGSYSVNMIIPRGGELWRCIAYRKYEGLSLAAIIGTLITDRIADILCLGVILILVVLFNTDFFISNLFSASSYTELLRGVIYSPWTYLLAFAGLSVFLLIAYLIKYHPQHRASNLILNMWRGIISIRSIDKPYTFILYSLLIWLGYFGFFYTSFFAFSFTASLPLSAGFIAFAMSSLSVLAPVQNGIGAWHFMVITTLVAYGIDEANAKSFALIVHTLQTLWITLVGLVAIILLPMINKHDTIKHNTLSIN